MNNTRTTIWSRPWRGWKGFLGWVAVLFSVTFTIVFILCIASQPNIKIPELLTLTLVASVALSLGIALPLLFVRWLCSGRNLRRFLFGMACFATLIALFYTEENVRGKLAWKRYAQAAAERGEPVDLAILFPAPVPDDQNFTVCPLLKPLFDFSYEEPVDRDDIYGGNVVWHDTNGYQRLTDIDVYRPFADYIASVSDMEVQAVLSERLTDFKDHGVVQSGWIDLQGLDLCMRPGAIQAGLDLEDSPGANVLIALEPFEEMLATLRDAARERPLDRWTIDYTDFEVYSTLLPHLSVVKQICHILEVSAAAKLATGDTEAAMQDLLLSWRLAESFRDEPFLISQLVRARCHRIHLQSFREGLARHQFTDAQLLELETRYRGSDLLAGAALCVRGERACGAITMQAIDRNPKLLTEVVSGFMSGAESPGLTWLARVIPSGWYDLNARTICQLYDEHILPSVDPDERRVWAGHSNALEAALEERIPPLQRLLSQLIMPASNTGILRCAETQAMIDQAVIACALERYHNANHDYPGTLDALSPQYLQEIPHDIVTGEAMIYQRLPDGRYKLYSVGWDQQDDGGTLPEGKQYEAGDNEDWVWEPPDPQLQPY